MPKIDVKTQIHLHLSTRNIEPTLVPTIEFQLIKVDLVNFPFSTNLRFNIIVKSTGIIFTMKPPLRKIQDPKLKNKIT